MSLKHRAFLAAVLVDVFLADTVNSIQISGHQSGQVRTVLGEDVKVRVLDSGVSGNGGYEVGHLLGCGLPPPVSKIFVTVDDVQVGASSRPHYFRVY